MTSFSGASLPEFHSFTQDLPDFGGCGERAPRTGAQGGCGSVAEMTDAELTRIIEARRQRTKCFDGNLFADPAWDILLDLYRAHLAQQRICVTSVCFGAGVPVSTALRWLNALEERQLARRTQDPLDGRRFFVALTEKGASAMAKYFASVRLLGI